MRVRKHRGPWTALVALAVGALPTCDDPTPVDPLDLTGRIDDIAEQYVEVGAMIGVVRGSETLFLSYGTKQVGRNDPPDEHSIFEIGSITKTFTTALLARQILAGDLDPDERVQSYLPGGQVTLPILEGQEMTLLQLATHRSGLPAQIQDSSYPRPSDYDSLNFYAAYTTEHVYDYLTNYVQLLFPPGTAWSYSNTGMGLLGHVLGLVDGTSYETLLTREIFDVLGMDDSSLFLVGPQTDNLALGHSSSRTVTPNYTATDIYQGAGFAKASLFDMVTYLKAHLGLMATPLRDALDLTRAPRFQVEFWGSSGMDWYTKELDDGQTVTYKGGRTSGYGAYIGLNESMSTGTVVLLNHSVAGRAMVIGEAVLKATALQ